MCKAPLCLNLPKGAIREGPALSPSCCLGKPGGSQGDSKVVVGGGAHALMAKRLRSLIQSWGGASKVPALKSADFQVRQFLWRHPAPLVACCPVPP